MNDQCPNCQADTPAGARFCGQCGTKLTAAAAATSARAERRQLSVLFCDLVDYTALAGELDPEELREVVAEYHEVCAAAVARHGGHIAQYLGDGVLVYFGYPVAQEDAAARAVRAGLELAAAVSNLGRNDPSSVRAKLRVRVGVHTGEVVVGELGTARKREQLALGDAPNIASRLQAAAEPGTLLISGATLRLVEGAFVVRDVGVRTLKGVGEPTAVYQVLNLRAAAPSGRGMTPLIGRDREIAELSGAWRRVADGSGCVVTLSGEPGIGKSRLLQALRDEVSAEPYEWLECRCSPDYQNTALYPFVDLLARRLESAGGDAARLELLERDVAAVGLDPIEAVPLFAALLSLPLPDRDPKPEAGGASRKRKIFELLQTWLLGQAKERPLVLAMEDLHWADPSTRELLALLVDRLREQRVLAVLTFRPEFRTPWGSSASVTRIDLPRLPRSRVTELVASVALSRSLTPELLEEIVERTDGVPLFVEELTKMLLESSEPAGPTGAARLASLEKLAIPATLQDSLLARLDRLGDAKEIAQIAAAIGRDFSLELLREVARRDETDLQQALLRLADAHLVSERDTAPGKTYSFRHALIRDAAYHTLLKGTRRDYHRRIADALARSFPAIAKAQPELVAQHFAAAGADAEAIAHWTAAGVNAEKRSAFKEAAHHFGRAIEHLTALPHTPERQARELKLQFALGGALMNGEGYGHPTVRAAYARANELCRETPDSPELVHAIGGMWSYYHVTADYVTARPMAERFVELARRSEQPLLMLLALDCQGLTLFRVGHLVQARDLHEQALALHHPSMPMLMHDLGVPAAGHLAVVQSMLGFPDSAVSLAEDNLARARDIAHAVTLSMGLYFAATCRIACGDFERALALADEGFEIAARQDLPYWTALSLATRGRALIEMGRWEEGVREAERSIAAHRITGNADGLPEFLYSAAEGYRRGGDEQRALKIVDEALGLVQTSGERVHEAEICRLRGELLLGSSETEAAACFERALRIARRQQARWWELRAAVPAARLMSGQGCVAEARTLLRSVLDGLSEGYGTPDVATAQSVLAELK